jgi:hypothetical protein
MDLGILETLEQEIAARLLANPFFANIEVHVDPQKNIVAEVTRKISQLRFLVAPFVSSAGVTNPDDEGPVLDPIRIQVGCFENPTYKLSSKWDGTTCRRIAEEVVSMDGLHQWKPESLSNCVVASTNAIEAVADKGLNVWNVNMEVKGGALARTLPQLGEVGVDLQAQTLGNATAGAAVFYTLDGTNPAPRRRDGVGGWLPGLLALPGVGLGLSSGTLVKARAWLAGYLPSDVLEFEVP